MVLLISLFLLFLTLLGTPLFIIMAAIAMIAFFLTDIELSAMAIEIYKMSSQSSIATIPLFTFAGQLLAQSGSPRRLTRLAEATLGWMPGGTAIAALITCAFFTAFTGASGVTIIALGGLLYPILIKQGYGEKFTLGMMTTSGSLGLLFPPSLPIILYGLVAKVDIEKLFLAGIIPGTFLIAVLSLWAVVNQPKNSPLQQKAFCREEFFGAIKGAAWEILLPIAILTGIYGGYATTTEAATLTACYVLIMVCFIYKELSLFKDIPQAVVESMSLVGSILLILCCALGLTNFLVDQEVPAKILEFMQGYLTNKYTFLFFLNIFLLLVGALMDIFSAIIVVVPLITPVALQFGVDPVHLAIIFLTNLEIGYITPPVGINLFIGSHKFKKPLIELYKASWPFFILLFLALMLITYIPWLSLVLL